MSFREKLVTLSAEFGRAANAAASSEAQEAMMEFIEAEEQNRPLRVGDIAPAFGLRDTDNSLVSSDELLQQGPLVVTFYRGLWCPYCQKDIQAFQDAMADLRSANASVAAISHQLGSDVSREFRQNNRIGFPFLEDETGDVAVQFGIRWAPDDLSFIQEQLRIPNTFRESEPWIVPMQARYVIGREGTIDFSEVAFDYSQRSDPAAVLPVLRQRKAGAGLSDG
jgi:peroxiredoxin